MDKFILVLVFTCFLLIPFGLSSAFFAPDNSITDLNVSISNDGNFVVGIKCSLNTSVDLNFVDSKTGSILAVDPVTIDCNSAWTNYKIKPLSKITANTLITIQADMTKYASPCKVCAKQVFVNYPNYSTQQKQQSIPDNNYFSLLALLAIVMLVLVKKRI
ncbi:MAG: hypothetical protein WC462_01860 [archaeon]